MFHVHKGIKIYKREGKGARGRGISGYRIGVPNHLDTSILNGTYSTLRDAKAAINKHIPDPPKNTK
jgi:hypothetical protein